MRPAMGMEPATQTRNAISPMIESLLQVALLYVDRAQRASRHAGKEDNYTDDNNAFVQLQERKTEGSAAIDTQGIH